MPAPKGTRAQAFKLASGDQVHVYSNRERVVLQLRHAVPTLEDMLEPSFKVAVELDAREILAIAGELLTAAARLEGDIAQESGE